jgi:hypothetical protein
VERVLVVVEWQVAEEEEEVLGAFEEVKFVVVEFVVVFAAKLELSVKREVLWMFGVGETRYPFPVDLLYLSLSPSRLFLHPIALVVWRRKTAAREFEGIVGGIGGEIDAKEGVVE